MLFGFGGWIILNFLPRLQHFDPFPFTFLTFVVSLEAIFLSTFILISQNHETRLSERRNHLDLQINLLTEQENTKMLRMLERIAQKVGAKTDDDPSLQVLDQATHPEKLIEQIENAAELTNPDQPTRPSPRDIHAQRNSRMPLRLASPHTSGQYCSATFRPKTYPCRMKSSGPFIGGVAITAGNPVSYCPAAKPRSPTPF